MDSRFLVFVFILVTSSARGFPNPQPELSSSDPDVDPPMGGPPTDCADGCQLVCRGGGGGSSSSSDDPNPSRGFCYCRCRTTIDYGSLVYAAVVEDIWQIRCGYLGHPFVSTALAMNESGLLDVFAQTRCESDYTDECRRVDDVCSQWWASSLCLKTCRHDSTASTVADRGGETTAAAAGLTTSTTAETTAVYNEMNALCQPDKYFRNQRPSFGNPYTGCSDFQRECDSLYDRGYCHLKPSAVNCQETCGRCVGDDAYMPWNPIRAQLIQWAMNCGEETAKTLITYFMRQYSDYMSEVHRSCRTEASTLEREHRLQTQQRSLQQAHRRRGQGRTESPEVI